MMDSRIASDVYKFGWPIEKVAIIGGGVSGLISYREFTEAGFQRVRLFERDDVPGGNWHYTDETPLDAPIPNAEPAVADYTPSLPPNLTNLPIEEHYRSDWEARWREHRGPRPVWESLESNSPAIAGFPWPRGTPWNLPHRMLARYLRAFASFHGVNSNDGNPDHYDETGRENGWTLILKRLERTGPTSGKATWWKEDFDAIVVATGRCNAPNIPNISGLQEWADKFPGSIIHSRQYRRPEPYTNESVLVVGGGANPLVPYDPAYAYLNRLPANVSIVPEIRRFYPHNGSIELVNGTYHNLSASVEHPIVTDGTHLRFLHEDFLYIADPTLGFLNMNWGAQTFTYAEYLSLALAKIWANKATLPSTSTMWRKYEQRVRERGGYGQNVRFFVGWLNDAAIKFGGRQIDGESKECVLPVPEPQLLKRARRLPEILAVWTQARYGPRL
ncbi:hypothetical protein B0H14DRAFT_3099850 [Mycena olivaceomarginata]|nr:hypothetical protein B0H14DRAFT_3099850 [Mycena olivaceomarginata]